MHRPLILLLHHKFCCLKKKIQAMNLWWMSFVCAFVVFTVQNKFSECGVRFQCVAQCYCSFRFNITDCEQKWKESLIGFIGNVLLMSSQIKQSFVSVFFTLIISLNDIAPIFPMGSICLKEKDEKVITNTWICKEIVLFVFKPFKFNIVSVVLHFQPSQNDFNPVPLIKFAVQSIGLWVMKD